MTEIYSVASDFGGVAPNIGQLHAEIEADVGITKTLIGVTTLDADTVHITFDITLSGAEKTILDGIVTAHVPLIKPDGNYNTAAGTDAGLTVPLGTFVYEITAGTETAPFTLTGPSAISGQVLNIRNDAGFATTGIVVPANGGATYAYNGTSWIQIGAT